MNIGGEMTTYRRFQFHFVCVPVAIVVALVASSRAAADATAVSAGSTIPLRSNWRFTKGEQSGAELPAYDDSAWETVRVPHDWAIAGPMNPAENGYAGKLPWRGVGWYRRSFVLSGQPGDRVYFDFDGVMAFPKVYINGKLAGEWDYGYTPFRIDATPFVNLQGANVIAVRVDTTKHGTRWYPGAGIYRTVTLKVCSPIHIAQWGTCVTTPQVCDESATISLQTTVENHTERDADIGVVFRIRDPSGKSKGDVALPVTIPAKGSQQIHKETTLLAPQRWDIQSPRLYTLETAVVPHDELARKDMTDSRDIDRETTKFGVRTFEFTANDGFHLNGKRVQLHGVNLHHDQGPLGAAFYRRAMERQLEIMRDMGVNALRTSHNPPAAEVLELCDRMGIVVWEEGFDKWNETADRVDGRPTHEEHARRHLRSMVLRDRNHPSVVVWSIGNEIPADRQGVTAERVKMMRDVVRGFDSTRPVGLGCSEPPQADTNIFDALDLTGWNYGRRYARYRKRYPDKPIVYSESASAFSTRGFYELPLPRTRTDYSSSHQVDSYDFNSASWSDIADAEFQLMQADRFVAGEFVWSGFDYLGEPAPFEQQAACSYFGIVDLCGLPKDRYFLYRSYWRPEAPTVHIVPHWNWPDRVGQPLPVFVYTNGDAAELFLNGHSLGKRSKGAVPDRPANLALVGVAAASSSRADSVAEHACDNAPATRWRAASDDKNPWWAVDLATSQPIQSIHLEFEREAKNYSYTIRTSADGQNWNTLVVQPTSDEPRWQGPHEAIHHCDCAARFVRIEFAQLSNGATPALQEVALYSQHTESSYYDSIYAYRLRWDKVVYEPGELKAVAYKQGVAIGSTTTRTAGPPAAIRVVPDRTELNASGDDLCYVTVEAVDKAGVPSPLADNLIRFRVTGAAEIAGVGNGNPLSVEPYRADQRRLFFGKALLILRSCEGRTGDIRIQATSDGLESTACTIHAVVQSSEPVTRVPMP